MILNRVGSASHGATIAQALHHSGLPRVLGTFTNGALPALPSRHLGLVAADITVLPDESLDRLAKTAESSCDLSAIFELAEQTRPLAFAPTPTPVSWSHPVRIGIARDLSFHFYYNTSFKKSCLGFSAGK